MGDRFKLPLDTDLLYEWGEDDFTERHQKPYVDYLKKAPGTVLEIGCGRGVMCAS